MQPKCPKCRSAKGLQLLSQREDEPTMTTDDHVPMQMSSYICDCGCFFVKSEPLPTKIIPLRPAP
jgi:hypothetical protein